MKRLVLLLLGLVLTEVANAQTATLPPVVTRGLELLDAGKCDSAFTLWTSTWTGPEEAGKSQQLVGSCGTMAHLGTLSGHDVIRTVAITEHLTRVFVLLRYSNQPVYLMLVAYKPGSDWKVMTVNWNTLFDRVVPASFFGEEHPGS